MRATLFLAAAVAMLIAVARPAPANLADPSVGKSAPVVVVDSPLAEKWLSQAGVPFSRRSGQSLGAAPLTGANLLILPMQSVSTPAAVANIREYLAGGGRLVAVYWGTLASDGAATNPAYELTGLLGVRPVSWSGSPGKLSLAAGGGGVLPYLGSELELPGCPAVVVEPVPGSMPVGRWVGPEAASLASGYVGAAYLRPGVIYLSANLLRPANDRPEYREILFWALQRVAPDVGPTYQAKERIASAALVVGVLGSMVGPDASPEATAGLAAAQAGLQEARAHLARGAAGRASVAADRSRRLALDLTERLKRQREEKPSAPD